MTLDEKRKLFQFVRDNYPPHLKTVPDDDEVSPFKIFNIKALLDVQLLIHDITPPSIPELDPSSIHSVEDLVTRNRALHTKADELPFFDSMLYNPNIGLREDWYTDAVFAQQFFTGTNPTTIQRATSDWVQQFVQAGMAQGLSDMANLIKSAPANTLYMQDYSYFRSACGARPDAILCSSDGTRFGCASVALFQLPDDGKLHPLAIILDYKGTMDKSIIIFNRRLSPTDLSVKENTDWPWRYAKTCLQVSDWLRHEVTIHLVNTHLMEEALIVAAHRTLPPRHVVFKILEPHWRVTLSVNALARSTLVPDVIANIVGVTDDQLTAFTNNAYDTFNWKDLYIPNDLAKRGFPIADLDKPKYHNYAYARDALRMWNVLRKFVSSILKVYYKGGDAQVAADLDIANLCTEMRVSSGAAVLGFPSEIKTLDDLTDLVTMCIHIAAPQHSAVNYLQEYYQVFVPNKPSALFAPLPKSLDELKDFTEQDMLKALPVNAQREWLLMAQVPYLLSFAATEDQSLLTYSETAEKSRHVAFVAAGKVLREDLLQLATDFEAISKQMDSHNEKPYAVLDPSVTANSIVI